MVTNYPHPIATHEGLRTNAGTAHSEGLFARVWAWMRQLLCGLSGHDTMLHFEQERIALRCVSCGHETPGWALNEPRPTVTVRVDSRRHALARPQLITARRMA